jgi:hypothetical protein
MRRYKQWIWKHSLHTHQLLPMSARVAELSIPITTTHHPTPSLLSLIPQNPHKPPPPIALWISSSGYNHKKRGMMMMMMMMRRVCRCRWFLPCRSKNFSFFVHVVALRLFSSGLLLSTLPALANFSLGVNELSGVRMWGVRTGIFLLSWVGGLLLAYEVRRIRYVLVSSPLPTRLPPLVLSCLLVPPLPPSSALALACTCVRPPSSSRHPLSRTHRAVRHRRGVCASHIQSGTYSCVCVSTAGRACICLLACLPASYRTALVCAR